MCVRKVVCARLNVQSRIKQIVLLRREELHPPLSPLPLSVAHLSPLPLPVDCSFLLLCMCVCMESTHCAKAEPESGNNVKQQNSERNHTALSKILWKSVYWVSSLTKKSTGCTRHLIMHRQNSQTPSATPSAPGRATACKTSSHRRP